MASTKKTQNNRGKKVTSKSINRFSPIYFWRQLKNWWHKKLWHKIVIIICSVAIVFIGGMYGVAQWYIYSQRNKPVEIGATFISSYAKDLGVDPVETLSAVIHDLGIKHLRLVSYWDEIEKTQGQYDFSNLDWQMKMAESNNVGVSLSLGLRQPRWPECHMPNWAKGEPKDIWYGQLNTFISKVIDRYKSSPALESYQLENEYFLRAFGECYDFSRDRLVSEANLVKKDDPNHILIITRSNNGIGLPIGKPTPDLFGVSIYKRVWDKTITHRYFEYPLPAWFYASLAGGGKIVTGKDLIVHELQSEAWTPVGMQTKNAPVEELYKSMDPARLRDRIQYAKATGMKQIDLWGVEWWYQMKVKRGEPGLWNTAKQSIAETAAQNAKLR